MAHQERHTGRGQPDKFTALVQNLYKPQELEQFEAAFGGLRGPLEKQVAQWQHEGIGRMIAVAVRNSGYEHIEGQKLQTMAFAVPLTDEKAAQQDRRSVILFASENGPHSLILVGPKTSARKDEPELLATENEHYSNDFDLMFRPSEKPSVVEGWAPAPGEKANESFFANMVLFSFLKVYSTAGLNTDDLLKQAVANARAMKLRTLKTDEYSLRETLALDSDLLAAFDVANRDWDQIVWEERQKNTDQGNSEAA